MLAEVYPFQKGAVKANELITIPSSSVLKVTEACVCIHQPTLLSDWSGQSFCIILPLNILEFFNSTDGSNQDNFMKVLLREVGTSLREITLNVLKWVNWLP